MKMFLVLVLLVCGTTTSCWGVFLAGGEQQDVGSPLRVAQCRATCLQKFSNEGPNGESMCLQGPDCLMCWENCELIQSNYQIWGAMCQEIEICFPGCQEACRFHADASNNPQQTQPVIHTKGEGVIHVTGPLARWPRPSNVDPTTPLVYVVMRKTPNGPWRQIIQTLDHVTRVPSATALLRVLVVDPQGLVTIYSPDEPQIKKKKKTINTEIKATTSRTTTLDSTVPWTLREVSLIHQKILVIGEIAWEPKTMRGVYLVTWEVDGGGLKGNLFTDSTCVTLSLWPDTVYHIQVELVSHLPGVANLKSQMMDLDTGRAQKVSTAAAPVDNYNSPLLSVLFSAARGGGAAQRVISASKVNWQIVGGGVAAIVLFAIILSCVLWRCRQRARLINNVLTGASAVRSRKLVEDYTPDFRPIITVMTAPPTGDSTTSTVQV